MENFQPLNSRIFTMNNHRKVLVFIVLTTFIYVLSSFYLSVITTYFPSFKNVSLFSEILKDKRTTKESRNNFLSAASDTISGRFFENYLKKGAIVSFDTDTTKCALKITNQKLLQLANGDDVKIRIAWFGDSQIEGDLITKDVRELLQNYFNKKNGVGFVPLTSVCGDFRQTAKVSIEGAVIADNFKQMSENSKLFLSGYSYFGDDFEVLFNDKVKKNADQINQKWLLYGKGDSITLIINGDTTRLEAKKSFNKVLLSESTSSWAKVKIKSHKTPIYGISSEPKYGVVVDNFSFRGISGENLNKISNALLAEVNAKQKYDLVIFQYGVNLLFKPDETNFDYYERMISPAFRKLKANFKNTDFLLLSCSDRAFKYDGNWQTAVGIDSLVKLQSKLAFDNKMAFYNLYGSIGGKGTIVKWADSTYQLANRDYIHFNSRGARKVGNLLFKALLNDYKKFEKKASKSNSRVTLKTIARI